MNILIPMAGAGKRFADAGYSAPKPAIPTLHWLDGNTYPMVVCAAKDLPDTVRDGSNIIYVDQAFHKACGIEDEIRKFYPKARFIRAEGLTDGQACSCLLAREYIDNDEELLIAGCDNGMVMDQEKYESLKKISDVIVFTYKGNEAVNRNPDAYGWVVPDEADAGLIRKVSVKKAVSNCPVKDHAIVATFWFRKGSIFVEAAEKMIAENDRINNEFYVDEVIRHCMELGYAARIFDVDRYVGWGTPADYENYMRAFDYWGHFVEDGRCYLMKEKSEK